MGTGKILPSARDLLLDLWPRVVFILGCWTLYGEGSRRRFADCVGNEVPRCHPRQSVDVRKTRTGGVQSLQLPSLVLATHTTSVAKGCCSNSGMQHCHEQDGLLHFSALWLTGLRHQASSTSSEQPRSCRHAVATSGPCSTAAVHTPLVAGVASNQLQDCAANIQGTQDVDPILPQWTSDSCTFHRLRITLVDAAPVICSTNKNCNCISRFFLGRSLDLE